MRITINAINSQQNPFFAGKKVIITKEKVLELIEKYHPMIISNEEIQIDDYSILKQVLDFSKIVSYYQDKESMNPHFVVPNYLKLPQALEEKHD